MDRPQASVYHNTSLPIIYPIVVLTPNFRKLLDMGKRKQLQLVRAIQPYKIFMGALVILIVALLPLHYTYTVINRVLGLKHIPVTLMPSNNPLGD